MNEFEGPRYYRLVCALSLVIEKICQFCRWDEFIKCFPPQFVEENKEIIYSTYTNAFHIFRENVHVSFFKLLNFSEGI